VDGPAGAVPHFAAQRPDHSPPELLGDDELARAIDSLHRKLRSARRMLLLANAVRVGFFVMMALGGFAILAAGPAPFVELLQGQRVMATTWDVFAWWFGVLAIASLLGAAAVQFASRRRRRAAGWRHRVEDLERRLAHAERVRESRQAG
jgi:hypothetical protein